MDPFEKLGVERALALDATMLEDRYRELSKIHHPDSGGKVGEFEEVRKAFELLKHPAGRLKLALERENSGGSQGLVPNKVMDFFGPMAEVMQSVDGLLAKRITAKSGLGRAMIDAQVPVLKKKVEELAEDLGKIEADLVGRFAEFDERGWSECQEEMGEVARGLTFLEKWQAQVRVATGKLFEALLG